MSLWLPVVPTHPHIMHFTRNEDPFFSNMLHCANETRSAFVASADRQMGTGSAGSGSTDSISVTHGSTGRLIPGGRSQRRSNYKVAVTLDQLVILTVIRASILRELGDWTESPENESVGHSQTRPESGRIFGMELTQASPQIYRQNLLPKKRINSQPKPMIFNILSQKWMQALF